MKTSAQSVALWISAAFGGLMVVAFLAFPGFFPPMSPDLSPAAVAHFYDVHRGLTRFSMITFNLCDVMLIPLFTVVVVQMKRMAGQSHVLAYAYLSAVPVGVTLLAAADLFWLIADFRPERDPQLIQLLNDMAWITFTGPVGMVAAQMLILALAVHLDRQAEPILPKWLVPFNILTAAATLPSVAAVAVHTGPLAWNGAVSFWLRIAAYAAYVAVMFVVLLRVVRRQEATEEPLPASMLLAEALA